MEEDIKNSRFKPKYFYGQDDIPRKEMIKIIIKSLILYAPFKLGQMIHDANIISPATCDYLIPVLLILTSIVYYSEKIKVCGEYYKIYLYIFSCLIKYCMRLDLFFRRYRS